MTEVSFYLSLIVVIVGVGSNHDNIHGMQSNLYPFLGLSSFVLDRVIRGGQGFPRRLGRWIWVRVRGLCGYFLKRLGRLRVRLN
jgi:hypothetical protein